MEGPEDVRRAEGHVQGQLHVDIVPTMSFKLLPSLPGAPWGVRVGYVLLAVFGVVVLLLTLMLIVVDITTTVGVSNTSMAITIVSAFVSAVHLGLVARSTKPFSVPQWIPFAVALVIFAWQLWAALPTSREVFMTLLAASAASLFFARLISSRQGWGEAAFTHGCFRAAQGPQNGHGRPVVNQR